MTWSVRSQAIFHAWAFLTNTTVFILSIRFFPHSRPIWWALTQLTSWALLTYMIYFLVTLIMDVVGSTAKWSVYKDRAFTVCLSLSSGLLFFFLVILLPFTPTYTHVDSSCPNPSDTCIAPASLAIVCLAHIWPWIIMLGEMVWVDHKMAYRNTYVELGILVCYVIMYLVWSLICASINTDWPYMVQNRLGSNSIASFFAHASLIGVFSMFYFLLRYAALRVWHQPQMETHYTDSLLSQFERNDVPHLNGGNIPRHVPKVQEYEISVFGTSPGRSREPSDAESSIGYHTVPTSLLVMPQHHAVAINDDDDWDDEDVEPELNVGPSQLGRSRPILTGAAATASIPSRSGDSELLQFPSTSASSSSGSYVPPIQR